MTATRSDEAQVLDPTTDQAEVRADAAEALAHPSQCQAETQKGERCKNRPPAYGRYCKTHANWATREAHSALLAEREATAQAIAAHVAKRPEGAPAPRPTWGIIVTRTNDHEARAIQFALDLITKHEPRPHLLIGNGKGERPIMDALKEKRIAFTVLAPQWEDSRGRKIKGAAMIRNEEMAARTDQLILIGHAESIGVEQLRRLAGEKGNRRPFYLDLDRLSLELNRSALEEEANQPTPNETTEAIFTYRQQANLNKYNKDPQTVLLALGENTLYCGRHHKTWPASILENPKYRGTRPAGSTLSSYKKHLYKQVVILGNPHFRRELERITPDTRLLCYCHNPLKCHVSIVIDLLNWQRATADGQASRMTAAECRDYDAINSPTRMIAAGSNERQRLAAKYSHLFKPNTPAKRQPNPDNAVKVDRDRKATAHRPYYVGQIVYYINGQLELPVTVTSVEYGRDFTRDRDSGTSRFEVINATLRNAQTGATFVYSDAHAEAVAQANNDREDRENVPTLLANRAPMLERKRPLHIVQPLDLTSHQEIQSNMLITIETHGGDFVDAGIARHVEGAIYYTGDSTIPAIAGPGRITYTSIVHNDGRIWTAELGTVARRRN